MRSHQISFFVSPLSLLLKHTERSHSFQTPLSHYKLIRFSSFSPHKSLIHVPKTTQKKWGLPVYKEARVSDILEILEPVKSMFLSPDFHFLSDLLPCYVTSLKKCIEVEDCVKGRSIHTHVFKMGFQAEIVLSNVLLDMYGKAGLMTEMHQLFDEMPTQDLISWSTVISRCTHNGFSIGALELFEKMYNSGLKPNQFVFASMVKACADHGVLDIGCKIHGQIIKTGFCCDGFLEIGLLDMYAKCGSVKDSLLIFNLMSKKDCLVSWNSIISGLVHNGFVDEAFSLYKEMNYRGLLPDIVTMRIVLSAGVILGLKSFCETLQGYIIKTGLDSDDVLVIELLKLQAKLGEVANMRKLFETMKNPDLNTFSVLVSGYLHNGYQEEAVKVTRKMRIFGSKPNQGALISLLGLCLSLEEGAQIHAYVSKTRWKSDVSIANALITMYAKCGSVSSANRIFFQMGDKDLVSWTAIVSGHLRNKQFKEAFKLLSYFGETGINLDQHFIATIIGACTTLQAIKQGEQIHTLALKLGFGFNIFVTNSLLNMYINFGHIKRAQKLFFLMPFHDVVSLNVMISGYCRNSWRKEALDLLSLEYRRGLIPDQFTFATILGACTNLKSRTWGELIHSCIIKTGFGIDIILGNSIINFYIKCGDIKCAWRNFKAMQRRDSASWEMIISGYARNGNGNEALRLFREMHRYGMRANRLALISVLKGCASLATALKQGSCIHARAVHLGLELDASVGDALIDMYAKCGSIIDAMAMFKKIPVRSMVSWNTIITGYAQHGYAKEALDLFEEMKKEGIKPDHITYVAVLSACSHVGMVERGRFYFHSMSKDHGLIPMEEHYTCMVDILSRAGRLEEAHGFLNDMPMEPSGLMWRTLLAACGTHGNTELGIKAARMVVNGDDSAMNILVSNIYAIAGRWVEVETLRSGMRGRGIMKREPGYSRIEVKDGVKAFLVENTVSPIEQDLLQKKL
ncbi:pentatricopeptide repeat-containing protein At3g02330 [Amborella trichopoda]|uniref:pentatricopeptide repeat-containing protein At3g02330 n=1 Tax=Amborella trichopoda TaxID=13333 RepID=UPI0009BE68DA|nr:pentatricopeptide repeat-containing protein At3g02330 [Amborella trichopoda]XP_020521518.1 pentatricopeptide repeat-containing protein At3g02330 [Amborella trichopoda]XP_020521519.1 pentatricopeptide repeat-containing protein At3g02330 [Amborella trichopoda]|eukprot:XP_011622572.2 pentatricopeptide repeat-containing protein At3g02330 [Amborella trichopoda]